MHRTSSHSGLKLSCWTRRTQPPTHRSKSWSMWALVFGVHHYLGDRLCKKHKQHKQHNGNQISKYTLRNALHPYAMCRMHDLRSCLILCFPLALDFVIRIARANLVNGFESNHTCLWSASSHYFPNAGLAMTCLFPDLGEAHFLHCYTLFQFCYLCGDSHLQCAVECVILAVTAIHLCGIRCLKDPSRKAVYRWAHGWGAFLNGRLCSWNPIQKGPFCKSRSTYCYVLDHGVRV